MQCTKLLYTGLAVCIDTFLLFCIAFVLSCMYFVAHCHCVTLWMIESACVKIADMAGLVLGLGSDFRVRLTRWHFRGQS